MLLIILTVKYSNNKYYFYFYCNIKIELFIIINDYYNTNRKSKSIHL